VSAESIGKTWITGGDEVVMKDINELWDAIIATPATDEK
jgi:hypothetical protein